MAAGILSVRDAGAGSSFRSDACCLGSNFPSSSDLVRRPLSPFLSLPLRVSVVNAIRSYERYIVLPGALADLLHRWRGGACDWTSFSAFAGWFPDPWLVLQKPSLMGDSLPPMQGDLTHRAFRMEDLLIGLIAGVLLRILYL